MCPINVHISVHLWPSPLTPLNLKGKSIRFCRISNRKKYFETVSWFQLPILYITGMDKPI